MHALQVFVIEFGDFAIEFVPFAIEFVGFATEFVPFALQLNSSLLQLNSSMTRTAAGENMKTWCSSCYKYLFKYNSRKQLFIRQ